MTGATNISPAQALALILDTIQPGEIVERSLEMAAWQFLAADVVSPVPSPLFDNSAMDGYAVRLEDVALASTDNPVRLTVAGVVAAGDNIGRDGNRPALLLRPGQVFQIFTGAMVPEGAEAVIRQEDVETAGDEIIVRSSAKSGLNIRRRGEEITVGETVAKAGAPINPASVGLLASLGLSTVPVIRPPRLGLIITGSELVEAGDRLAPGMIYNSNRPILTAALGDLGITPVLSLTCMDDRESIHKIMAESLAQVDCLIISGGVSVGDFDFVKEAVGAAGVETVFWKVNQKPGKPLYFGCTADRSKLVFGLPGNPASMLTCFYEYVKPALRRMMGSSQAEPKALKANLGASFVRRSPGLVQLLKGLYDAEGRVSVLDHQGSHMMSSFANANCLVVIPADVTNLEKGDQVTIHLVD